VPAAPVGLQGHGRVPEQHHRTHPPPGEPQRDLKARDKERDHHPADVWKDNNNTAVAGDDHKLKDGEKDTAAPPGGTLLDDSQAWDSTKRDATCGRPENQGAWPREGEEL